MSATDGKGDSDDLRYIALFCAILGVLALSMLFLRLGIYESLSLSTSNFSMGLVSDGQGCASLNVSFSDMNVSGYSRSDFQTKGLQGAFNLKLREDTLTINKKYALEIGWGLLGVVALLCSVAVYCQRSKKMKVYCPDFGK